MNRNDRKDNQNRFQRSTGGRRPFRNYNKQNEDKLDESEKEIRRLRKENE